MARKQKTGGRKRGTPNRLTQVIREGSLEAWERLGGVDGLVKWCQRDDANYREFIKLFLKMVPKEVEMHKDGELTVNVIGYGTKNELEQDKALESILSDVSK